MRQFIVLMLISALFLGCASSGVQITLLPEDEGKVGVISIADNSGKKHTIDKSYAALEVTPKGEVSTKNESENSVNEKYTEVLKALPPKHQSYLFYFGFDSDVLTKKQIDEVKDIAKLIKESKIDQVLCIGHSDSAGDKEYNKQLSLKRARSVANALIANAVDKSLIKLEYYGDANPLDKTNANKANAKNRRVEIILK